MKDDKSSWTCQPYPAPSWRQPHKWSQLYLVEERRTSLLSPVNTRIKKKEVIVHFSHNLFWKYWGDFSSSSRQLKQNHMETPKLLTPGKEQHSLPGNPGRPRLLPSMPRSSAGTICWVICRLLGLTWENWSHRIKAQPPKRNLGKNYRCVWVWTAFVTEKNQGSGPTWTWPSSGTSPQGRLAVEMHETAAFQGFR